MPGMDGPQLISHVRKHLPQIPVLLITGYGGPTDSYTGALRLAKPFGQAELVKAVEDAIESSHRKNEQSSLSYT